MDESAHIIKNEEDIKVMLDSLLIRRDGEWWDDFYQDKEKDIPFFVNVPDENLLEYLSLAEIDPGKALDIGCGNGRNSIYLASKGFEVTAIDFSSESIKWAEEINCHANIHYRPVSFLDIDLDVETFDFVYDGGCLHHMKPHRRPEYLIKVHRLLKDKGIYGMAIFNEKGGGTLSDYEVYIERSMKGGRGYSEAELREVLSPYFNIKEMRAMKEIKDGTAVGKDFCWAVLMEKAI